ncbi:MAG TPA: carboxypeptidase regulatory-like domain-containing protein [Bryobacteraceae bacterium]
MKSLSLLFAVCLFALCLGIRLNAQAVNGTLVGTVRDSTGAVTPNAHITITETNTNVARAAQTDANGYYSFPALPPGTYDVKVEKQGFAAAQRTAVPVSVNTTVRVDLQLQPGQITETVNVASTVPLLQTDTARTGETLSAVQAQMLPLGNNRNFQDLLNIVPGATPSQNNHSRFFNAQNSLNNEVNGTSSMSNNFQIEGVNDNERTGLLQVYIPPIAAIQEVDVTTSGYDPEQGSALGAVTNVIFKSGTNQFHGSAYEIWRGDKLDARNVFDFGTNGQPFVKPRLVTNYFGGAIGGPIIRNKAFFFFDFLRTTDHEGQFQRFGVPTVAMRNGDFSDSALTKIFDPQSGDVADCLPGGNASNCGKGRTQFPGNRIPGDRIDPITAKLLALVPTPNANLTAPGTQKYSDNFQETTGFVQDNKSFDAKVDENAGDKDHISVRLSYMNPVTVQDPAYGAAAGGPIGGGFQGTGTDATYSAGINWNHIFSPTFLTQTRLGLNRYRNEAQSADYGKNSSTAIGIPGVNVSPFTSGITGLNSTGFSDPMVGYSASLPWVRAETDIEAVSNWTKIIGNHTLEFGGNLIRLRDDLLQEQTFSPRGRWSFSPTQTALNGGPGTSFANNFASLLLGVPDQVGRDLPVYFPAYRAWQLFLYGGDKWQVTPKLTVNLGLRWAFFPPATPQFRGGFSNYDGATNSLVIAGVGGNPTNLGMQTRYHNFAPRVGIAYRLTSRDVIRAGFGISYQPFEDNTYAYNFPVKQNNAFNSLSSYGPAILPDGTPATFAKGFPAPLVAAVPSNGIIPVDTPLLKSQSYTVIPKNYVDPYVESWNLTYERALPAQLALDIGYVGNRGVHIPLQYNLNAVSDPAYIGQGTIGRPYDRAYGIGSDITMYFAQESSNYNSLQVTLNRHFHTGVTLTTSYTYGKALGYSEENNENSSGAQYYIGFRRNYARTDFDRTQMFNQSFVWSLPFGKGRKFFKSGPLSAILGGWEFSGVWTLLTGTPLNFGCTCVSLNAPGNGNSPDLVAPFQKLYGVNTQPWFSTSSFADPSILSGTPTFGNVGRYILSGPGLFNFDAAAFRNIRITERVNLQFRTDWYSATNTPHFNNPGDTLGNSDFGRVTGAGGSRTIDLGAELSF